MSDGAFDGLKTENVQHLPGLPDRGEIFKIWKRMIGKWRFLQSAAALNIPYPHTQTEKNDQKMEIFAENSGDHRYGSVRRAAQQAPDLRKE